MTRRPLTTYTSSRFVIGTATAFCIRPGCTYTSAPWTHGTADEVPVKPAAKNPKPPRERGIKGRLKRKSIRAKGNRKR